MQRNLCQLLFTGAGVSGTTGYTATFNNNIILNDNGPGSGTLSQSIGIANENISMITLGGVISGNASLTFQLGSGSGGSTFVSADR